MNPKDFKNMTPTSYWTILKDNSMGYQSISWNKVNKKRGNEKYHIRCIHTSKQKFIMSNEKFELFKKLSPTVLDSINNQTNKIVTCFESEKSFQNINICSNKTGKTIEEMIQALIPKQINKLCSKDSSNKLYFVWSNENYEILISSLQKAVNVNQKNKECLVKSKTIDEYAKCLVKSKL